MWFDKRSGDGMIRRDGHEYPVRIEDIEQDARVPYAPVHFDISRQGRVKRAVNVTLRRGGRVGRRQHRFGDLAGAHHPDEKGHHPLTDDHPGLDPSYEGKPVALIEEWVRLVDAADYGTLRLLYLPQAELHIGNELVLGRDAIVDRLKAELLPAEASRTTVTERNGMIIAGMRIGKRVVRVRFRVEHGRVAEQWM